MPKLTLKTLLERKLTKTEKGEKEKVAKKLEKGDGWSKRYGKRGKAVKMAVATIIAKKNHIFQKVMLSIRKISQCPVLKLLPETSAINQKESILPNISKRKRVVELTMPRKEEPEVALLLY